MDSSSPTLAICAYYGLAGSERSPVDENLPRFLALDKSQYVKKEKKKLSLCHYVLYLSTSTYKRHYTEENKGKG